MKILKETIRSKFNELTKRQQVVAAYVSEHVEKVAFHTAKELGDITNTSESTVIRFCYNLGFSGYSDLQKVIQQTVVKEKHNETFEHYRHTTEALNGNQQLIELTLAEDIYYIHKLSDSIDMETLNVIIKRIIKSKNRIILGFRSSHAPASWLAFSLNVVIGNSHLYRVDMDDAIHIISQISTDSLVIAFSFPRYAQETLTFVQAAKKRGASILAITDNELSPVGILADYILKVESPAPSALKGMPVIFSLLNLIVNAVAVSDWEDVKKRLEDYENISYDFFPFVKPE
ncbi:MAG TPA: MurR/RpiR family transcriptional regulator [Bacillus sp. (in: firmicutes)]|uniref:MurR/RpiR family transcriptional regulator n=1 Tax=Bacillus litorisediminis TaxID=2922713 RepID=UPI001FAFB58E|nr:MurR/RpiR family transcriptional regulator [Bacillus litorisediminis]HWO78468.1 MurR/RpiR family transcriptional regulator [Bacillus sp. (in: firmicutes)]